MEQTLYAQTIEIHRKAEAWDKLLEFTRRRYELKINFCGYNNFEMPLFTILCGSEIIAPQGTAKQILDSLVG